jgi:hypothetical protein
VNAPIRTSGFTEGLCFALAHEWQPERLLMFAYTAYLDESGTHEGSDTTVMGGLLARADHWKAFEQIFEGIQRKHGFRVFHTKKFKRRAGDFKGWTNERCLALIDDLALLTSFGRAESTTVSLPNMLYDDVYRSPHQKGVRARFDSRYGLCFRQCLLHFVVETTKHKYRKKIPPLDIVLEAGHTNWGDAKRIFFDIKRKFSGRGGDLLRHISFVEKDSCGQLMMADFLAHMALLTDRKVVTGTHTRTSSEVPKGQGGISHYEYTQEVLARLREEALRGPRPVSSEPHV